MLIHEGRKVYITDKFRFAAICLQNIKRSNFFLDVINDRATDYTVHSGVKLPKTPTR